MELVTDYFNYCGEKYSSILEYMMENIIISFTVKIIAVLIFFPLTILITRLKIKKMKNKIYNITNLFQTIPTIAIFEIMIPIFGIGFKPSLLAMFLYSLLSLLRNTYASME